MSGSSSFVILLAIAAVIGGLFLFSAPAVAPVADSMGVAAGSAAAFPQAATAVSSLWADAGVDRVVGEREAVRLSGAGGSSGGSVTYRWAAVGGLGFFSDPTRPDAIYTSPSACDCCQEVTLTLTVTDRTGATARDTAVLQIRDPLACPSQRGCGEMALAGVSTCPPPPCPPALIKSRCPEPDVPCAGPCVSQAPAAPACHVQPVPCPCDQGCGAVWNSSWPHVGPSLAPEERPTPRIVRQFPAHVAEESATPLRAVVTNPACSSVCFSWSASQGWFERADTLEPVYHAPEMAATEAKRVTITFTIHDATGRPSYDQIRLTVDGAASP